METVAMEANLLPVVAKETTLERKLFWGNV